MYSTVIPISLGSSRTGLALAAQLYDPSDGSPVGSPIFSGFIERVGGRYDWSGSLPDNQAIGVAFLSGADELASTIVNPSDAYDMLVTRAWIASLTEPVSLNLESAVGVDGSVKVRRGDSYTTGSKHGPLVWPGTATVWGAYVGVASVFTARDPNYRGRSFALEAIFEDMGEGVIQCRVELPSLATGSLSDQSIEEPWDFDVQATEDTLVDVTPIFGSFTILKDVTPPSVG